jgi:putative transposase
MTKSSPFKYFKTSPEILRLAVMLYVRFPLSPRNVEDLLHERGVDVSHETVRIWWHRFGPMFASEIRKRPISGMKSSKWRWHLDEFIVTDRLRSYGAAPKVIRAGERQETGRCLNNRAENSHLPFRRRERAMLRFRQMRRLQTFATVHASVLNHFNQERSLSSRHLFNVNCATALARVPWFLHWIRASFTVQVATGSNSSDTISWRM